eukprot:259919_1
MQCQPEFCKCNASARIISVLERFHKVLDKNNKSNVELEREANELIHNVFANGQLYSNVQLMNDFYHIKYNHNTNDHRKQFDAFYEYFIICDNEHALQCDIAHCQAAKRHFHRRHQISSTVTNNAEQNEDTDLFTFDILCRIHTYFIHSHDVSRSLSHECKYIENNIQYIETAPAFGAIDCDKMASVLQSNNIDIDSNALQRAFDESQ